MGHDVGSSVVDLIVDGLLFALRVHAGHCLACP